MSLKEPKNIAASPKMRGGVFFSRLLIVALFGLLIRVVAALEIGCSPWGASMFFPDRQCDMATYITLAQEIAGGKFHGVFYYQPFYYAVFLVPFYLFLSGKAAVIAVVATQIILSAATILLIGSSAKRIFGSRAALFTAIYAALSPVLIMYCSFVLNETLEAFLLSLLLFLVLKMLDSGKIRFALFAGIVCGCAAATRGNIIVFIPLTGAFCFAAKNANFSRRLLLAIVAVVSAVVILLPFSWINYCRSGLCFPSSAGDAVLALGNTLEAPPGGREPGLPAGPMEYPQAYHLAMKKAESGVSMPRQMLDFLIDAPGAFIELQFRKILLFWDSREIPNNISFAGEGRASRVITILYAGGGNLIVMLAVGGIIFFLPDVFRKKIENCNSSMPKFCFFRWSAHSFTIFAVSGCR